MIQRCFGEDVGALDLKSNRIFEKQVQSTTVNEVPRLLDRTNPRKIPPSRPPSY